MIRLAVDHTPPIVDHSGLGRAAPWQIAWRLGSKADDASPTVWEDLTGAAAAVLIRGVRYPATCDNLGYVRWFRTAQETEIDTGMEPYTLLITKPGSPEIARVIGNFIVGFTGAAS